jgi:thymidylate synthase
MDTVIDLLKHKKDTRQAVIQIFDASDLQKPNKNVPCTCTLQFLARGGKLHMFANMRSNDAYLGLPHDIFAFTIIQELVARSISHEIGRYSHAVGSLHLYEDHESQARRYLDEGWQEKMAMPPMPEGDPWPSIAWLQDVETSIRLGGRGHLAHEGIDPYWVDLARLLRIKALLAAKDMRGVVTEKNAMSSKIYDAYIRGRERGAGADQSAPQLSFREINVAGGRREGPSS